MPAIDPDLVGRILAATIRELARDGAPAEVPAPPPKCANYHTENFELVVWEGMRFLLTPSQRLVVKRLWEAWESGRPEVDGQTLIRAAGSDAVRLVDLFRNSVAWGTLVVKAGATLYRLAPPAREVEGAPADLSAGGPRCTCPAPDPFEEDSAL